LKKLEFIWSPSGGVASRPARVSATRFYTELLGGASSFPPGDEEAERGELSKWALIISDRKLAAVVLVAGTEKRE